MASKQPLKLFDIKGTLIVWGLKLTRFIKHNIFMKNKELLLIGQNNEIANKLIEKLGKRWSITYVVNSSNLHERSLPKYENVKILNFKDNSKDIQQQLSGTQFQSIAVLPNLHLPQTKLEEQFFAVNYLSTHQESLILNTLAYHMAHKQLSKLGVVILSCNEQQFLKRPKEDQYGRILDQKELNIIQDYPTNLGVIDSQVTYLGFVMGERDYTSLTSSVVTALSSSLFKTQPTIIATYYCNWINRKKLPFAGSYALFRPVSQKTKKTYVQYL